MQVTNVRSPVWANADHTAVNCLVTFDPLGEQPYTASADDTVAHSRAIFAAVSAGEFGAVAAYVAPPPPPVIVPRVITMRQARLALLGAGKLAAVNAAIAAMESPAREAAEIEWEYAAEVDRDNALIGALASAIGLDDTALDALFTAASVL